MQIFMRFVVTILAAVAVVLVVVNEAPAQEVNAPIAAKGENVAAFRAVGHPLPGARFESVLTDLPAAVADPNRGTRWLLHYGTERDNCARADALSGLRAMCLAW